MGTILGLLDGSLIPGAKDAEAKVFYYKMKGDYYRYIAEFTDGDKKSGAAQNAKTSYDGAMGAASELAVTHPIRLGLALNFSVFYYEVLNSPDEACKMARTAFEDAIAELDNVSEESYKDSTLIMQIARQLDPVDLRPRCGPAGLRGVLSKERTQFISKFCCGEQFSDALVSTSCHKVVDAC